MSVIEQRPVGSSSGEPSQPLYEKNPKKKLRTILRNTAAGLAATAVIGSGVTGKLYADDELLFPKVAVGFVTNGDCDTSVSPSDLLTAHQTMTSSYSDSVASGSYHPGRSESDQSYKERVIDEAKKRGLTVIDNDPAFKKLKTADSVDEVLSVVNSYTSNFDLKVELAESTDFKDIGYGIEPVKKEDIDLKEFKKGAANLLWSFTYLPTEVVKESGMNTLKVTESIKPDVPFVPMYEPDPPLSTNPVTGIIYTTRNTFYRVSSSEYFHEIEHGLDKKECGLWGMLRDPEFHDLNPKGFKYGKENKDALFKTVAASYGQKHVIEDKATVSELLFSGFAKALYQYESPVIQQKQALILARLEKKVPNITEYISAIG